MDKSFDRICWCGNAELERFSAAYRICNACKTLVVKDGPSAEKLSVRDDDTDFYGKQYWLGHQKDDLGFADIEGRARSDLSERNLYWLETLLKIRLPGSTLLELGCAHGSFLALAKQAGYQVKGVEMSPWVVAFGESTFDVPIVVGPLEALDVHPGSVDVIVLMDVLEHLPDPLQTMRSCLAALKPDGVMLVQTPCLKEDVSFEQLVQSNDRFLEMLIPDEHIYIFSRLSASTLFHRLGARHIHFEPALFPWYDMYFVVGRQEIVLNSEDQIVSALSATGERRIALALLDVSRRERTFSATLEEVEIDRADRAQQISTLNALLAESETDRAARGHHLQTFEKLVSECEADRAARGRHLQTFERLVTECEADRAARGEQIDALTLALKARDGDSQARSDQIGILTNLLKQVQAESLARFQQIETLTTLLTRSQDDLVEASNRLENLARRLQESDADRTARGAQVETLTNLIAVAESDRAARGIQIEILTGLLAKSETDRADRAVQIETLTNLLNVSERDRADRGAHLETLTRLLAQATGSASKAGE